MITRLINAWNRLRASLWLMPTLMSGIGIAFAVMSRELDGTLASSDSRWMGMLLYRGDLDGARTLLSTVAGSMITVTGVTFSVTVVALSLASSQFGPRLLLNFMRDRGNQFVLGTFISTFLYCLVALGSGGAEGTLATGVSASTGLALAVASVGALIYFIHHVSSSIRAEYVVDVVAQDVMAAIERVLVIADESEIPDSDSEVSATAQADGAEVGASRTGYIQALDEAALIQVASRHDCVVHMVRRPGHFVVTDEPIARVVPPDAFSNELAGDLCEAVIIGRFRTDDQDPEYGIHQLVEVAVRALSPGVNDPHTAISCIDWLTAAMHHAARSRFRSVAHFDDDHTLRLVRDPVTFEGLMNAAFNQIRQCACATPAVSIRMMESFTSLARVAKGTEHEISVKDQAALLLAGCTDAGLQTADREDLEARHGEVMKMLTD